MPELPLPAHGSPRNGQEGAFWGCSMPVFPQSPSCCRCSALGIRCHFPAGTECPARPPAGEHCQGLLFCGEDRDIPFQPPIPTHLAVPELRSAVCTACVACCARMNAYKNPKAISQAVYDNFPPHPSPFPSPVCPLHPHPPRPSQPLPTALLELPGMAGPRYVTQVSNRMRFTEGLSPSGSLVARRRPRDEPKSGREGSSRSLLPS